jgi:hypothetical protein
MRNLNNKITSFVCETEDGHFVATLANGWVRVGLRGNNCYDFSESHPDFERNVALNVQTVEDAYDEYFGRSI